MTSKQTATTRQDETPVIRAVSEDELRLAGGGSGIVVPIKVKHNL
jgi:hypothetical protein